MHRFAEFEKKDAELSQKKKLATQKLQKIVDDQATREEELKVTLVQSSLLSSCRASWA